MTNFLLCGVGG